MRLVSAFRSYLLVGPDYTNKVLITIIRAYFRFSHFKSRHTDRVTDSSLSPHDRHSCQSTCIEVHTNLSVCARARVC